MVEVGRPRYHGAVNAAAIEARLRAFFEDDQKGAIAAYLFGSTARDDARPGSDVDVGVLFGEDPPATLEAPQFVIEGHLEHLLGLPVQVVALNRAPADLVHRVLRDGRIVLDRDPPARIRFEVRRRNEYFDLAPIRQLYRGYPPPTLNAAERPAEPRR
jgi:uncharacterized protein